MKLLSNLTRKVNTTLSTIIVSILILCTYSLQAAKPLPIVAISQFISHEAVDSTYKGLIDELKKQGYIDGKTIKVVHKNAAGNMGTNASIANLIKSIDPTVAVGLTTPSAQSLVGIKAPLVFSIITDPIEAKLVKTLYRPGGNITGVSDMPPHVKQIELIKAILCNAKLIAVPYNPGESNSVRQVEIIKTVAQKHGLKVQTIPVSSSAQIKIALSKAIGADAFLIPLDNILVGAMPTVIGCAKEMKIPVFTSEYESVIKNQALACVGYSYYDMGAETGKIVARILKGEKPGDIDVSAPYGADYYFNLKAAKSLNIQISGDLLKKAKIVK